METQIREIIADILDVKESEIDNEFSPESTNTWDSMNNLRLITAFEDEFDIKLTMEEIQGMVNYSKILETISRYV